MYTIILPCPAGHECRLSHSEHSRLDLHQHRSSSGGSDDTTARIVSHSRCVQLYHHVFLCCAIFLIRSGDKFTEKNCQGSCLKFTDLLMSYLFCFLYADSQSILFFSLGSHRQRRRSSGTSLLSNPCSLRCETVNQNTYTDIDKLVVIVKCLILQDNIYF